MGRLVPASSRREVRVGIIGKYVSLPDAYLSVVEALKHGGFHHGAKVEVDWIQAEEVEGLLAEGRLRDLDGIVIPGGFGERGVEGKIAAAGYAREHRIPCLGLCLGMQVMTIEFARNVLGMTGARPSSTRRRRTGDRPHGQPAGRHRKGGTMRLGAYVAELVEGSIVAEAYEKTVVSERHRHRYEFNPRFRSRFEGSGFVCSGTSPDGRLVEFIELADHPFWVGTQAHPEFKSRPNRPAPLFREFVAAALDRAEGRRPHLFRWTTPSPCGPPVTAPSPARLRVLAERPEWEGRRIAAAVLEVEGPTAAATARWSATPGRSVSCRSTTTAPSPSCASTGRRSTRTCGRCRPACATWTANRPR